MVPPGKNVALRSEPLVLSGDEVRLLNEELSKMRHDINNNLTVLVAAIDLIRYKPDSLEKWLTSIKEQPSHINDSIRAFSGRFEQILGICRGSMPVSTAKQPEWPA